MHQHCRILGKEAAKVRLDHCVGLRHLGAQHDVMHLLPVAPEVSHVQRAQLAHPRACTIPIGIVRLEDFLHLARGQHQALRQKGRLDARILRALAFVSRVSTLRPFVATAAVRQALGTSRRQR